MKGWREGRATNVYTRLRDRRLCCLLRRRRDPVLLVSVSGSVERTTVGMDV